MKRSNTILAAAFLLVLFAMAGYTLSDFQSIRKTVVDGWHAREAQPGDNLLTKAEFAAEQAEGVLNASLDREHYFIQLYGGVQRLTGQRIVEEAYGSSVVRMDDGSLTFGSIAAEKQDVAHNAMSTAAFASALQEELGVPFTAVITPHKVPAREEVLPAVLRNHHNEEADQFLSVLEQEGVDTLDLREHMDIVMGRDFYRTDHHWTARGAFQAAGILTSALSERCGFTPFAPGLEEENYTVQVYEDLFLGSQGKRVGTLFAGVDDFEVWYPDFHTDMTYFVRWVEPRSGTLEQLLYYPQHLQKDWFNANPYVTFTGGDWGWGEITNHQNPDGPTVVMIRDSFGCAITPFLSLQFGKLVTIDLRAFGDRDLMADIAGLDADLVLLLYNPSTVVTDSMFDFRMNQ